jgi:hypothetical protein
MVAKTGNHDLFQPSNAIGQGLVIAGLAQAIVADEDAFEDVGKTLASYEP